MEMELFIVAIIFVCRKLNYGKKLKTIGKDFIVFLCSDGKFAQFGAQKGSCLAKIACKFAQICPIFMQDSPINFK
jgi:hypothetical protein